MWRIWRTISFDVNSVVLIKFYFWVFIDRNEVTSSNAHKKKSWLSNVEGLLNALEADVRSTMAQNHAGSLFFINFIPCSIIYSSCALMFCSSFSRKNQWTTSTPLSYSSHRFRSSVTACRLDYLYQLIRVRIYIIQFSCTLLRLSFCLRPECIPSF